MSNDDRQIQSDFVPSCRMSSKIVDQRLPRQGNNFRFKRRCGGEGKPVGRNQTRCLYRAPKSSKAALYLPSTRTYFTSPSACSGVRLLYDGILPLPLVMAFFRSASDCF